MGCQQCLISNNDNVIRMEGIGSSRMFELSMILLYLERVFRNPKFFKLLLRIQARIRGLLVKGRVKSGNIFGESKTPQNINNNLNTVESTDLVRQI